VIVGVIYPPTLLYMVILVGIYFTIKLLRGDLKIQFFSIKHWFSSYNIKKDLIMLSFYTAIIIVGSFQFIFEFEKFFTAYSTMITGASVKLTTEYSTIVSYFNDDFFIISILIGLFSSAYIILYIKKFSFIGFFILSYILLQISTTFFGDTGFIFFSRRFSMLIPIFSWISISLVIHSILINIKKSSNRKIKKIVFNKYPIIIGLALFTVIFVIQDIDTYLENKTPTPYKHEAEARPCVEAMMGVVNNTEPENLILTFDDSTNYPDHNCFVWIKGIEYRQVIDTSLVTLPVEESIRNELFQVLEQYNNEPILVLSLKENEIDYIVTNNNKIRNEEFQSYDFLNTIYKDESAIIYETVLDNYPTLNELLSKTQKIEMEGDYQTALENYRKIRKTFPAFFDAWTSEIRILSEFYGYKEAKMSFNEFLRELDSKQSSPGKEREVYERYFMIALEDRANMEIKFSQYEDAILTYNKIMSEKKIDLSTLLKKAEAYEMLEEYQLAIEIYENHLIHFSDDQNVKQRLNNLYSKLDN